MKKKNFLIYYPHFANLQYVYERFDTGFSNFEGSKIKFTFYTLVSNTNPTKLAKC